MRSTEPATAAGRPRGTQFLPDLCGFDTLFVVVVVAALVALIIAIAGHGLGPGFSDTLALVVIYAEWLALAAAAALCMARRGLNRLGERGAAAVGYLLVLGVAYVVAETAWWVVKPVVGLGTALTLSRGDLILRTLVVSAVVAALVMRYFYVQFHYKQRIASEASARLEALQARIRPHFLFNSMNTIASLTRSDPPLAERVVEDLAELFRASLADARAPVPAAEEIAFVERYLNIERLRLGARLAVDWELDELPPGARLPLLSLQPIVENAIYHGIEPAPGGGRITISVTTRDARLVIDVHNPLPAVSAQERPGNRIALANVGERLRAHFGPGARLETARTPAGFHVRLEVPLQGG